MAIVWPCPVSVDAYAAAGRGVQVPRPDCLACGAAMTFWSGYWRHLRAAGGIVADSEPEAEYQETVNKAKAMLKAVALAESFTHRK